MLPRESESNEAVPSPGPVVLMLQLFLIPVCVVSAFVLPTEWTPRQRIKMAMIAWTVLTSGSAIAAGFVKDVRVVIGFLLGPERFRRRWVLAQLTAWIATVAFACLLAGFFYYFDQRKISDAIGFSSGSAIAAGIGFYLLAMSVMPLEFFEEDRAGKAIYQFLGCTSLVLAPLMCRFGFAGFLIIAFFLAYTPYSVFSHHQ